MLRIHDFDGPATASTPEEVERLLAKRYENDFNGYWIFPAEHEYPAVSLLVKGQLAFLTYTANENEAGYVSDGGVEGLTPGEQSLFFLARNQQQWVSNDSIVSARDAVEAVKELLVSPDLPRAIKWFEL